MRAVKGIAITGLKTSAACLVCLIIHTAVTNGDLKYNIAKYVCGGFLLGSVYRISYYAGAYAFAAKWHRTELKSVFDTLNMNVTKGGLETITKSEIAKRKTIVSMTGFLLLHY